MDKLTVDNIDELAKPVESTRQTVTPDVDGKIFISYEMPDGAGGSGDTTVDELFPDKKVGMSSLFDYSYGTDAKGEEELYISTYSLNEDGTVTFVVYMPR